jgi:leucyl aminopeptidase
VMAGSSMWGAFIGQFVMNGEKFTHLDIAGPAFLKEPFGVHGMWATGFWVESLSYVIQNYGKISQR